MSSRFITGNLAADPEAVQAGNVQIVKFRVIENTGEYRGGKFVEHPDATTHFVEAKFEFGANVLATLHRGDAVGVSGREHTASWGPEGNKSYGRVIAAEWVGPGLGDATAQITRNPRQQ
jgi:single-strand DNA-binding protein